MSKRGENIYKRKDGRWEGRLMLDGGGYQYFYGKTYKEVREKRKGYLKSPSVRTHKTKQFTTEASEKFARWINGDVAGRVKPSTYECYYRCITKYVIPYFKNSAENWINAKNVGDFVKSICENQSLSGAYKKKIVSIFKIALREIEKNEEDNALVLQAVKLPSLDRPQIQVFTGKEQRMIETAVARLNDSRAFGVLLCFYTGIRLGELCALKWGDIDYETKIMSISKTVSRTKNFRGGAEKTALTVGSPKSQNSIRKIPVPNFLIELSANLKGTPKSYNSYILSGTDTPLDPRTFQRFFKKILTDAGVNDRKFHAIRHTFATRALEAGVDIKTLSEILGHSSAMITLKVYTHSLMEQKIAAMNKLNGLYIAHMNIESFAVKNAVMEA